jgi:hypothetical protein
MNKLKLFKSKSKSGARLLNRHSDWTAEHVQLEALALVRTQHSFFLLLYFQVIISSQKDLVNNNLR